MKYFINFIYFILLYIPAQAQDNRTQYPGFLKDAYFGVNLGYINYDFSQRQLKSGYVAEQVNVPHFTVRVILYGRRLTEHLSAQISYMRPAGWVEYKNINGDGETYTVGMNLAGLTLTGELPVTKTTSIYGEGGLGIVTRSGFFKDDVQVVSHANYATVLLGGGIKYKLNRNWELGIGGSWSPVNQSTDQPATTYYSAGFNYTMRERETVTETVKEKLRKGKNLVQIGYTSNAVGYGVNKLFSKTVPIFWGGKVELKNGLSIQYQRNIYQSRKSFSFHLGTTFGYWTTRLKEDKFFTAAVFPQFRFSIPVNQSTNIYFNYSLAGPCFISKTFLDNKNTGNKFTFQDFMGMGIFAGKNRKLNAELRIAHFSNGNIFPVNEGVKVPLTLYAGFYF